MFRLQEAADVIHEVDHHHLMLVHTKQRSHPEPHNIVWI